MRYIKGGVELQYRECQIMREAARIFQSDQEGYLTLHESQWIDKMASEIEEHPIKQTLIPPMIQFLSQMDDERKGAVLQFVEYLVRKDRGIDVMIPYTASNNYTILPVNVHESMEKDEEREE